jgi:hypothetical protein
VKIGDFAFVGSESGQIQSVKLMQNMISKQNLIPPPHLLIHTGRGGGVEPERRVEGQHGRVQITKLG